jgi:flagellin-like protein
MKILKSKKALSPVVASIILIAVTVAVSIAVAAWMGALTIGFMGSSSITITKVSFPAGTFGTYYNVTMKNTGTKQVTVSTVKVNNVEKTFVTNPTTLDPGATASITVTCDWVSGNPYKIELYDSSGQVTGSTQTNAPGA